MKFRFSFLFLVLLVLCSTVTWPLKSRADYPVDPGTFDQNNLISDFNFTNADMTGDGVNNFLQAHGSWLANYVIPQTISVPYFCKVNGNVATQYVDVAQTKDDGTALNGMRAADLLASRAALNNINPQVILSILERESSSVTSSSPSSDFTRAWPLFYGFDEVLASAGYSCADAKNIALSYGGVGHQLAYTPFGLHNLFGSASLTPTVDSIQINASGHGTAALYAYTPHIRSGNYNFWYNYTRWFSTPPPPPYNPALLIKGQDVYFADNGRIWHILSSSAFSDFGFDSRNIQGNSSFITYPKGGDVGSLVSSPAGKVYLISAGRKRPITSPAIFNYFGYNWSDIRPLDDTVLDHIPTGIPLYEMVRATGGSRVYIQSHGNNYHVTNPDIFGNSWKFDWNEIADVPTYEVNQFPAASDINRLARDNDNKIYFIDNGKRYWIPNPDVFAAFGFDSNNVIWLENYFLNRLPVGEGVVLNGLIRDPSGNIYLVSAGQKHFVSAAAYVSHNYASTVYTQLSQSGVDSITTGTPITP